MIAREAHYPGRPPIDAYGNGGFRFADMSHRGSILILPSGVYGWEVAEPAELGVGSFSRVFAEGRSIELLVLGIGPSLRWPPDAVRTAFRAQGIGLEVMDTGAAARTYNVLLAEDRAVAAALIAVDEP